MAIIRKSNFSLDCYKSKYTNIAKSNKIFISKKLYEKVYYASIVKYEMLI